MRKILSIIIVMRPHNVAAAVLSVAVGFAMTGSTRWPWLVFAAAAFATAAGNTINDIYDVDIDRINKPRRPLAAGALSINAAIGLYAFFFAASVLLMLFLPGNAALWIGVWIVLLHIYSWRLKRMYLAGNILVSAVAGSGFLLGAYAGGNVMAGADAGGIHLLFRHRAGDREGHGRHRGGQAVQGEDFSDRFGAPRGAHDGARDIPRALRLVPRARVRRDIWNGLRAHHAAQRRADSP